MTPKQTPYQLAMEALKKATEPENGLPRTPPSQLAIKVIANDIERAQKGPK